MLDDGYENYDGREQTWVKHYVLRKYLMRFARIIGSRWSSITFVDGFSGPWNVQSRSLADSSFYIALTELRKACNLFSSKGRQLSGIDRDDAITERYCRALKEVCGFDYVHRAIVLHSDRDQSHFQLIYGTRHPKGVEKFKEVEKKAMEAQDKSRAHLEIESNKQPLFSAEDMPESQYYVGLRDRYFNQAKQVIEKAIWTAGTIDYDELWIKALAFPMVREHDLKAWMMEWRDRGEIDWHGLGPREKTLKRGNGHAVSVKEANPPVTPHG